MAKKKETPKIVVNSPPDSILSSVVIFMIGFAYSHSAHSWYFTMLKVTSGLFLSVYALITIAVIFGLGRKKIKTEHEKLLEDLEIPTKRM